MFKIMQRLFIIILFSLSIFKTNAQSQDTYQLIRNATSILHYAGKKIVIDPMLMDKGVIESWAGIARNPTVELPIPIDTILNDIDFTLVTHMHPDHFDSVAKMRLPENRKIFYQPFDEEIVQKNHLTQGNIIRDSIVVDSITIIRTEAQHGTGKTLKKMGNASGFVLKADNHPTIYIVGDGVWTRQIKRNIKKFNPDYIIINSGGAVLKHISNTYIIMDDKQAMSVLKHSGNATVIAVHMEALDHCTTTRAKLRETANVYGYSPNKLIIPQDGEIIELK